MSETLKRIIRSPHNSENPYVMIRRAIPQDRRLSWEARGVLSYLLSKPDDWEIQPADLRQNCGRDKAYSILGELRSFGYLEYVQVVDENHLFVDFEYHLHEVPLTVLPDTASPVPAKPEHTYKRIPQKKESKQKKESSFAGAGKAPDRPTVNPETPKKRPIDQDLKDAVAVHIQEIAVEDAENLTGVIANKIAGVMRRRLKTKHLTAEQYQELTANVPLFAAWCKQKFDTTVRDPKKVDPRYVNWLDAGKPDVRKGNENGSNNNTLGQRTSDGKPITYSF